MLRKLSGLKLSYLLLTSVFTTQVYATGLMSCDSEPRESWGTKQDLRAKLSTAGWVVRKIKVDAGCYEVYGVTPEDQRVEAYFDPIDFTKLLVVRRGEVLYVKPQ